jgi:hypothetical protein
VGDGIFDDLIGRGEQLLAHVRLQPARRHTAPPRSAPQGSYHASTVSASAELWPTCDRVLVPGPRPLRSEVPLGASAGRTARARGGDCDLT